MNELQKVFSSQEFGQVRTFEVNGKILFAATDIAKSLGYANPHKAILDHCKRVTKREVGVQTGIKANGSPAMQQIEMNVIPEGDVYRLVARSELPGAEKFESWIFDDVLPSILKYGIYATDELLSDPDLMVEAIEWLKNERNKNKLLQNTNKPLEVENKLLSQENVPWANRKFIDALVKKYAETKAPDKFGIQQAWTDLKKELLYRHGIDINLRINSCVGRKIALRPLNAIRDDEVPVAISTMVALCKQNNVDISEVIKDFEIGF